MNWLRLTGVSLVLGTAGLARADDPPALPAAAIPAQIQPAGLTPPTVPGVSPVAAFRRLLGMSIRERETYLTNRPAGIREGLRAKIKEYLAMDPDARELRLRATELRWQLLPLLRMAPADRGPRLALVPEDLAPLVKSRLADWDKLPKATQDEFLANDRTLHYFAHVETTNGAPADGAAETERERIAGQFDQFFALTPDEKDKTLKTLSTTERAQMQQTLEAFGRLTGPQRRQCLRSFTKFAELSPAERTEFLKNAERWAQMSPQERQTWRDLVLQVPSWPPVPMDFGAPLPPGHSLAHPKARPTMATN